MPSGIQICSRGYKRILIVCHHSLACQVFGLITCTFMVKFAEHLYLWDALITSSNHLKQIMKIYLKPLLLINQNDRMIISPKHAAVLKLKLWPKKVWYSCINVKYNLRKHGVLKESFTYFLGLTCCEERFMYYFHWMKFIQWYCISMHLNSKQTTNSRLRILVLSF